jgi:putative RNA 2'-phosphotransferase
LESEVAIRGVNGKPEHVCLPANGEMMPRVGVRHGKPVVLAADAGKMVAEGCQFFATSQQARLTDCVSSQYLSCVSD